MARKNSTSAAQTTAEPIATCKSDLLNEMNKRLGILAAQLSMMVQPDGCGLENMLDEHKGWYIVAMEEEVSHLQKLNDQLWGAN
jgi:hypothetical protein